MRSYYINLAGEVERRAHVEKNFDAYAPQHHELKRVEAISAREVRQHGYPGKLKDTEKACILSHKKAIEASLADNGNTLVLEDDASIGPIGFEVLDGLLNSEYEDIDVIFTSALVANTDFIFKQYFLYRRTIKTKKFNLLNMRELQTAGTDSYIVCKNSKTKVLKLLNRIESYDTAYDLLMKKWIHAGELRAFLVFPFLTYLSDGSESSQISHPNPDWNQFRRLFSIDFGLSIASQEKDGIGFDEAVDRFTDEYLKFMKVFLTKYSTY